MNPRYINRPDSASMGAQGPRLFVYEGAPLYSPAIGMNSESDDRFLVTADHWLRIRRRSGNPRLIAR